MCISYGSGTFLDARYLQISPKWTKVPSNYSLLLAECLPSLRPERGKCHDLRIISEYLINQPWSHLDRRCEMPDPKIAWLANHLEEVPRRTLWLVRKVNWLELITFSLGNFCVKAKKSKCFIWSRCRSCELREVIRVQKPWIRRGLQGQESEALMAGVFKAKYSRHLSLGEQPNARVSLPLVGECPAPEPFPAAGLCELFFLRHRWRVIPALCAFSLGYLSLQHLEQCLG